MLVNLLAIEVILRVACRGFPSGAKIYNLLPQIADLPNDATHRLSVTGIRYIVSCTEKWKKKVRKEFSWQAWIGR